MRARLLLLGATAVVASCIGLQDLGDRRAVDGGTETGASSGSSGSSGASGSSGSNGSSGSSGSSGVIPETVRIPAGSFAYKFRYRSGGSDLAPARLTHDFYVDTHEVTVKQFRAWVEAGKPEPCANGTCSLEPGGPYQETMRWYALDSRYVAEDGYRTCTGVTTQIGATYTKGNDDLPVNCVNYPQAVAACYFRGMRLLTDVEWLYIASGRGQDRKYVWGDTPEPDCAHALFGLGGDFRQGQNGCGFPKPVLATPGDVSRDGVYDMAGSLVEWVWSSAPFGSFGTQPLPDDYPGTDRDGSLSASKKLVRGAGYWGYAEQVQATWSEVEFVNSADSTVGFRCAKTIL